MVDKILVPTDGSEQAHEALKKALDIAEEENAEVTLMHVISRKPIPMAPYPYAAYPTPWLLGAPGYVLPFAYPVWAQQYEEGLVEQTEKFFNKALDKAEEVAPDVDVELMLTQGKPAEKILDVSEDIDYDLIVMGSTGLGDVGRFLLGSVSSRVKSNSDIPVRIFNGEGEEIEDVDQGLLT